MVLRSLAYYWRTNVAVVLGVATAVSVLAGALLVGDSVRGSLRDLLLGRLGRTDQVIASSNLFREQLAQDLTTQPEFNGGFSAVTPLVVAQGTVTVQNENRRLAQARVSAVRRAGRPSSAPLLRASLARAPVTRFSFASSAPPMSRSSRCTVSAKTWVNRYG
jgi:hypothetical protein